MHYLVGSNAHGVWGYRRSCGADSTMAAVSSLLTHQRSDDPVFARSAKRNSDIASDLMRF